MSTEQAAASFNPDDASGLLDNARVTVKKAEIGVFTSAKGDKFVNMDFTYAAESGDITEHYMIGGADQWAPNATKTGVIALREGGRIWNKSDAFKLMKSFIDAGFPKAKVGNDLGVFVGADVHVQRVVQEGAKYTGKDGQERNRTTLLVTKIYAQPGEKAVKGAKGVAAKTTAANPTPAATTAPATAEHDEVAMNLLLEIVGEANGSIPVAKLAQPAFIKLTRAKQGAIRQVVTARIQDAGFLGGLAEQGLIAYDGQSVSAAA